MAKSTTKKSSTKFDIEKIRRFTQTEFAKLSQEKTELPFCYQIGTDVLVGIYRVSKIHEQCWRVTLQQKQLFDFFNRKDAVFYCIALHKQRHDLADNIREADTLLSRLEFDAIIYRKKYKKSIEEGDSWNEDMYSARYHEVMDRIDQTKKEIKKNIDLAKYIKD